MAYNAGKDELRLYSLYALLEITYLTLQFNVDVKGLPQLIYVNKGNLLFLMIKK